MRPFINDMAEQYKKAGLIICRAGATTLAEITALGKMSVLIPYPHATHNHQEHNARILESAKAALMILDKDVSGERLAQSITSAMEQPEKRSAMENNCFALGKRDATQKALQLCLELLGKSHDRPGGLGNQDGENALLCF